jgi:dipeptidase D
MNLDSEEEGAIYVGCSGGRDTLGTWKVPFEKVPAPYVAAEISVKGLRGGHSGLEIDKGRGNAIKIINRVLMALSEEGTRLSSINGGNKRNAIPRECVANVFIPKTKVESAKGIVTQCNSIIKAELATVEKDLIISIVETPKVKKGKVVKKAQQKNILQTIAGLPHGVIKMSADIPGLVETSTNVAVINTTERAITLATSQRSSVASEINEICESVKAIFELGGAKVEQSDGYPGWKPNLDSSILKVAKQSYQKLYGKEPHVKAIHAGLECGIIGEKYPGMDMISFGPTLEEVHSPDEKIYIDSVDKFWNFLLAILKNAN